MPDFLVYHAPCTWCHETMLHDSSCPVYRTATDVAKDQRHGSHLVPLDGFRFVLLDGLISGIRAGVRDSHTEIALAHLVIVDSGIRAGMPWQSVQAHLLLAAIELRKELASK